jgi:hypothetical protein
MLKYNKNSQPSSRQSLISTVIPKAKYTLRAAIVLFSIFMGITIEELRQFFKILYHTKISDLCLNGVSINFHLRSMKNYNVDIVDGTKLKSITLRWSLLA